MIQCIVIEVYYCVFVEFTEQNSSIGLLRGDDFTPLTNFVFRFTCKVTSPDIDNADYSGFMVQVKTCAGNGMEEKGYVCTIQLCIQVTKLF